MRKEYPRPELVRKNWLNLNGEWQFGFDYANNDVTRHVLDNKNVLYRPFNDGMFDKKINVPFAPESKLSGIGNIDFFGACRYRKTVKIPEKWQGRIILHFEACYYNADVFIGGKHIGSHSGGYTPFSFDVTDEVKDGKLEIIVHADGDPRNSKQPSGKQSGKHDSSGCFYTRTTGIWQTVWLENVPDVYLTSYKTQSDIANGVQYLDLLFNEQGNKKITLTASFDGKKVASTKIDAFGKTARASLLIKDAKLWNVGDPNLYDLKITVESEKGKDEIKSYFGMREVSIEGRKIKINGKTVFQRLVLDQGFYPDGVYTAPTAEDLKKDIEISMAVGFNGARLHEKVFERRFLYYADKAGYLCWGEYPSWG
ncbi:MAG: beta-galactosidase, partial [Clostridia bacterium]|nr:beta-galactosidase [Clostridia bacterium]